MRTAGTICAEKAFTPREVEEVLCGELGELVRDAVCSVVRLGAVEREPVVGEVRAAEPQIYANDVRTGRKVAHYDTLGTKAPAPAWVRRLTRDDVP